MTIHSKLFYLFIVFILAGCSNSNDTLMSDDAEGLNRIPVWTDSSIKADLYLLTLNELREDGLELLNPIGSILRSTATPEQLAELQSLIVDRPFERIAILCDTQAGHDVFYLIVTDQDETIHRFPQYDVCGFSINQGDGYFLEQADGFLDDQQICDFGLSFGVEGFSCSERSE